MNDTMMWLAALCSIVAGLIGMVLAVRASMNAHVAAARSSLQRAADAATKSPAAQYRERSAGVLMNGSEYVMGVDPAGEQSFTVGQLLYIDKDGKYHCLRDLPESVFKAEAALPVARPVTTSGTFGEGYPLPLSRGGTGERVPRNENVRRCLRCRKPWRTGSKFCPRCGNSEASQLHLLASLPTNYTAQFTPSGPPLFRPLH